VPKQVVKVKRGRGRPLGATSKTNELIRKRVIETGETPLEYMLRIMRSAKAPTARRDAMAIAAAPYCHSRLTATTVSGVVNSTIKVIHEGMSNQEAALAYLETLKADPKLLPPPVKLKVVGE
jgi:hypothetical protein